MVSKAVILLLLNAVFFGFIVFTKLLCFPYAVYLSVFMVSLTIYSQWDGDGLLMLLEACGKNSDSLKGKVVWITGASSGIGKACAFKFAQLKCRLVLSSRGKQMLEEVKKSCIEVGNLKSDDVLVLPFDITQDNLHEQACQTVLDHFGQLDILLSNAGSGYRGSFETGSVDVDSQLFNINVFGPVNLARVVTKYFLTKKKGQHVVVSSVTGRNGLPDSSSYGGSKFALHGIFESLRAEHGAKGIAVTMLDVGSVDSNLRMNAFSNKSGQRGFPPLTSKQMSASRCATLISLATLHRLPEVYICQQPGLAFAYITHYLSSLMPWILNYCSIISIIDRVRDGDGGDRRKRQAN